MVAFNSALHTQTRRRGVQVRSVCPRRCSRKKLSADEVTNETEDMMKEV